MDLIPQFDKNAAYIWAVYGLSAIVLGGMILGTLWRARAAKRAADRQRGPET